MRNTSMVRVTLASIVALGLASPAIGREAVHGFVKDQYYLGRGGIPATPEKVAADPMKVFRSKVAYDALRAHFSDYLGRNLSDADFRKLIRSNDVRLTPCFGTVDTAGITDSGRETRGVRTCYNGEMLIELRLEDSRWVVVASMACWNKVYDREPTPARVIEKIVYVPQPAPPALQNYTAPTTHDVLQDNYPHIEVLVVTSSAASASASSSSGSAGDYHHKPKGGKKP